MSAPGDRLIDPAVDRPALVALVDKYDRMLALRRVLGRGRPTVEHRDLMRALAADFPGALRELELVSTVELERRAVAARAAHEGLVPEWLLWTARYHVRMRDALRAKRLPGSLPHGRLNAVVFHALSAELGVPLSVVWDRLFPTSAHRPHRLG